MLVGACLVALGLSACGRGSEPKATTQVAVRVNDRDITVHQINQVLAQSRQLDAQQAEAAGRVVLERLIDQELALQQATDQKVDREPAVVAAIEAARRDVIARAYIERVIGTVAAPTPAEIQAYFNEHPQLFAQRQIYTLAQLDVALPEARLPELRTQTQALHGADALAGWLSSESLTHAANQTTQAAESVPLELLPQLAGAPLGQGVVQPVTGGARVWFVVARQPAPVALAQARPVIEQAVVNERKRNAALAEVARLRSGATLAYQGAFAEKTVAQASPQQVPTTPTDGSPAGATATPAAATGTTPAATATQAVVDDELVKKGLGLK